MLVLAKYGPWYNGNRRCFFFYEVYFRVISHIFHFHSSLYCSMLIAIELQSSPTHRHSATHVVRRSPDLVASLNLQTWYTPLHSCDDLVSFIATSRSELEQSRRPVMATENDLLMRLGTHLLMTSPRWKQVSLGTGTKCPWRFENVYMFAVDSVIHVLLLLSTRRTATSFLTGGSNLGRADTVT